MILQRLQILKFLFLLVGLVLLARLFYWQVIVSDFLIQLASNQYFSRQAVPARRGQIYTSDNFPLVQNQDAYLAYAYTPDLRSPPSELIDLISPLLGPLEASSPAELKTWQEALIAKLNSTSIWIPLAKKVPLEIKHQLDQLQLPGLGFDLDPIRFYPEASTAAHLLGFVGRNDQGLPQGYFGLEGFYDLELRGRPGELRREKDATGQPIPIGIFSGFAPQDGRDLVLHLNRAIQLRVEEKLAQGLARYGAKAGEVIVMDPRTGGILALAATPNYDPAQFVKFDRRLYKNPAVADSYEPGSTFKVLVMAAALDAGVVTPETRCDICTGPLTIGKYTLRTWNNEYHPDSTMAEIIDHSDNIGMVFVGQKLTQPRLVEFLKAFGLGQPTGIDLQEETVPSPRLDNNWGDIGLATASFGQGIAVTGMQMLRAVSAIANSGQLLEPHLVAKILSPDNQPIVIKPRITRQVVSPATAKIITDMMVSAVESGEAQWTKLKGYQIAGKTGTAQIPVAGHYDEEKTIASFVGFAPADDPKFAMLVKLREPQSSPWAAETAAPLWLSLAKDLLLYYGIPPEN